MGTTVVSSHEHRTPLKLPGRRGGAIPLPSVRHLGSFRVAEFSPFPSMRLLPRLILTARNGATVAALSVAAAGLAPLAAGAQDSTATPPATPRTTADSSFTEVQAERGAQVFTRVCLECHERVDMSNADFRLKWSGQTTFDLFKNISTTMPDSDPGILPRQEYVDVVSYILKLNGVPAGLTDLVEDSVVMSQAKLTLATAEGDRSASAQAVAARRGQVAARRPAGVRQSSKRVHGSR